jgi:type IV pilus assembly protein PilV
VSRHRQGHGAAAGFTLLELLVALVILSIGLLGVAKLSLGTVQSNDSALMRSQATELVQHIVDDMRANQPQAAAGAYNIATLVVPGAAPACVDVDCGAAGVAAYDLSVWKTMLATSLPVGDGSVLTATEVNPLTGANETVVTVTVQWDDSVAGATFDGAPVVFKTLQVETML